MKPLTTDILIKCGAAPKAAALRVATINELCELDHVNTFLRLSHFLSQILHESIAFTAGVENLNYSVDALRRTWPLRFKNIEFAKAYARRPEQIANFVYANRLGNGDVKSGDGWRYRGRGDIQCTGKDKYRALSKKFGIDYVEHPEYLERPADAIKSAFWYWTSGADVNINILADLDDVEAVTKAINGALIGFNDRKRLLAQCKTALAPLFA